MTSKPTEFDSGIRVDGNAQINGTLNVLNDLNVSGNLTFVGVSTGNLVPATDLTYSIGNTSLRWLDLHTRNLVANTTHTLFQSVKVTFPTVNTTIASISIPPGSTGIVPAAPANGDVWVQTVNSTYQVAQIQLNAATKNVATENFLLTLLATQYYSRVESDARFANLSAPVITVSLTPSSSDITLGNTTNRWQLFATSGNFANVLTVSGNGVFLANLSVQGNLLVQGSPIDVTAGHITTLANGITFTGDGVTNSNIIVTRAGAGANATIRWNEAGDAWLISHGTGTFAQIVASDAGTYNISILGNAANATFALNANNASNLGGQLPSFYLNATNLSAGIVPEARLTHANATTNGILQVLDSVVNTSILIAASANSVRTAFNQAATAAATAYANAVTYTDTQFTVPKIVSGLRTHSANLNPSANGINLGLTNARWHGFFSNVTISNEIRADGSLVVGSGATGGPGIEFYQNAYPIANNHSLGLATRRWQLLANVGNFSGDVTVSGNVNINNFLVASRGSFTVATGTAPFIIQSNTLVNNLNVQFLNGLQSSDFNQLSAGQTVSGTKTHTADILLNFTGAPSSNSVGYRSIPWNSQSTDYTLAATDVGKTIKHPDSDTVQRTFTVANSSTVTWPEGATIMITNGFSGNTVFIAGATGVTLRFSPSGSTGTRTLAKGGVATLHRFDGDTWFVWGLGVT